MLHIILTILKIVGILILVVLALLLVVTGVVLFVPIRYRVNGKKDEESFFVKAEVYWLLHLFRLKAVYPEPGRIIAKVLWFTVYDSAEEDEPENPEKKKSKKEKKNKKEKNQKENQKKKQRKSKEKLEKKTEKKSAEKEQTEVKQEENQNSASTETDKQNKKKVQNNAKDEIVQEKRKREQTAKKAGKIKAIIQKILSILQNIRYTIRRFCDKIKEIWANIQYYMEVFGEEETKRAFSMCKQQLYKIWKNIRPQKCKAELKIGTGEPDTTGYILAVHGMLSPLIGNNISIEPDFENQVVEGTVFIKGRITVFVLLCAAIKLYFDDDIRHFLKRFKSLQIKSQAEISEL